MPDAVAVPVSALEGDNVVERSGRTPWYDGPTVLDLLETVPGADELAAIAPGGWRVPVQYVLRPQDAAISPEYREYRGYAGQVAEGTVRVGDAVVVQPSGTPHHRRRHRHGRRRQLTEAVAGTSISIRLADDVDVARGDLLSAAGDAALPVKNFHAHVAWLTERPLQLRERVLVQHGSALVQAMVVASMASSTSRCPAERSTRRSCPATSSNSTTSA